MGNLTPEGLGINEPEMFFSGHGSIVLGHLESTRGVVVRERQLWQALPAYTGELNAGMLDAVGGMLRRTRNNMAALGHINALYYQGFSTEIGNRPFTWGSQEYEDIWQREVDVFTEDRASVVQELHEDGEIILGLDPHVLATAFTERVLNEEEVSVITQQRGYVAGAEEICTILGENVKDTRDPALRGLLLDRYDKEGFAGVETGVLNPLQMAPRSLRKVESTLFPQKFNPRSKLPAKCRQTALVLLFGNRTVV